MRDLIVACVILSLEATPLGCARTCFTLDRGFIYTVYTWTSCEMFSQLPGSYGVCGGPLCRQGFTARNLEAGPLVVMECNLASFASIRAFPTALQQREAAIDILVLNAAIRGCPKVLPRPQPM